MNHTSETTVPDPTAGLFLFSGILILLWVFDAGWASLVIAGALVLAIVIYLFCRNLTIAVATMIAATTMSRFFLPIGGWKVRPEHVAAGLLCCAAPFVVKRKELSGIWIVPDYLLVAYIGLNFLSSGFTSPDPSSTSRWALQQSLVILPYFLLRLLIKTESGFRRAFVAMLLIGVLQAAYALVCFLFMLLFGIQFGISPEQYGSIAATYGMQLEPNILGSYSSACLVMLLWIYLRTPKPKILVGIAITYAAAAISLSRAALGGLCFAVLVLFACGWKMRAIHKRAMQNLAITLLAVSMALAPALISFYVVRFSTLNTADITSGEDTLGGRVISIVLASEDILEHPVLGTGTSSFQLTFDWSEIDPETVGGWIDNTEVRVLHDTGLIGLTVFASFFFLLVKRSWNVLKRHPHPELGALAVAALVYCVSFQTTEGTLMAFFWVHMGMIGRGLSLYSRSNSNFQTAEQGVHLS